MILLFSLLGSPLAHSSLFGKKTEPVLKILNSGEIVKTSVEKSDLVEHTGLNIHTASVAALMGYVEEMNEQKISKRKKKKLVLELLTDPPLD